ncbi:MAG: dihydroorotate dehydrogenase [Acidimicrobiales bacterium]|nr:dihydroorotate dehydrogenase [Acidimicrobiales bacterium]
MASRCPGRGRRVRSRFGRRRPAAEVDLSTVVGSVALPHPLLGASGTAGYGAELAQYFDLSTVGGIVTKSLAPFEWAGNPAPRVHETAGGMINSVGLQGPGVEAWLDHELPELLATGTRVVASIWGRTVADYEAAATMLADAPAGVIAVEVNISCPNTEDGGKMFAHSVAATTEVVEATSGCKRPRWAKLSPNTLEVAEIALAAAGAGAEAVTLTNTLIGMAIDPETGRPRLGGVTGGLSGPAMHPVAVRAVYQTAQADPHLPIIGVGGVASAADVVEFLLAGARAVQIGTATFADPRSLARIGAELATWCSRRGITRVADLIGGAHPDWPQPLSSTSTLTNP